MSYRIPIANTIEQYGLGSSIIFHALSYYVLGPVSDQQYIFMHPIAFAGWLGFAVTSANLLPIGQSDGGHIAYALFGGKHRFISITLIILLIIMGVFMWPLWIVWAILFIVFGIRHQPLTEEQVVLDRKRKIVGWLNLIVLVITFIPIPVHHY